jgi:peptide/nickel transport system permease protein
MFVLRRLARLGASLLVLLVGTFFMLHLIPGDPVRASLGVTAPSALVEARRAELGLDDPLGTQFLDYTRNAASGDFGTSLQSRQPVGEIIADRLPSTLGLALPAVTVTLLLAVPLGTWLAMRTEHGRHRGSELAFTATTGVLAALPEFLVAVAFVALFAVTLGWLPPAGKADAASYVLPVAALAVGPTAVISRLVRVETLRVLGSDYIRTAYAKRLPPLRIYLRHVLPNSLTATLTAGGVVFAALVAGSVLVENVFAWPGLGSRIVESIVAKDYPVAQGVTFVYGAIALVVHLLVDVAIGLLDPRSHITAT